MNVSELKMPGSKPKSKEEQRHMIQKALGWSTTQFYFQYFKFIMGSIFHIIFRAVGPLAVGFFVSWAFSLPLALTWVGVLALELAAFQHMAYMKHKVELQKQKFAEQLFGDVLKAKNESEEADMPKTGKFMN